MPGTAALSDNELIAQSLQKETRNVASGDGRATRVICTRRDLDAHGPSAAFGTLVLRYRKLVLAVAYRMCGDAALAEDIAQDTFVRVWDRLSDYRPEGNFKAWVVRIATNLTIDAMRKRRPVVDIEAVPLVAPEQGPEAAAVSSERAAAVRAALMRLPVQSRTVLVLREYQALSYQEIAGVLDVPIGTVKSRLNDARRRLKTELASYMGLEAEAQNGTTR
jgi:RNA polymerase sigma-70 factor (ECF subfamily)